MSVLVTNLLYQKLRYLRFVICTRHCKLSNQSNTVSDPFMRFVHVYKNGLSIKTGIINEFPAVIIDLDTLFIKVSGVNDSAVTRTMSLNVFTMLFLSCTAFRLQLADYDGHSVGVARLILRFF